MSGLFITFEGGEGSGKSTQARLLATRLTALGYAVTATREPGGTPLGEIARALSFKPALARRFHGALTGAHWRVVDPLAELFLMEASRAQLVGQIILPALESGGIVVSDRFDDSTVAYQGAGRGLNPTTLREVNAIATRGLRPHLTVLIDVPPELGILRKAGEAGQDVIGGESFEFHRRVREAYRQLAATEPQRWLALDGSTAMDTLAAEVWQAVETLLTSRLDLRRTPPAE